jgi:hypothetical protein
VYDEADQAQGQMDVDDTPIHRAVGVKPKNKGKGKANAKQLFDDTAQTNSVHSVPVPPKRRRPLMDPFAASGPSHFIYIYKFLFIHISDRQGSVLGMKKKRPNLASQPYQTRTQNHPSRVTENHHLKQRHRLQISQKRGRKRKGRANNLTSIRITFTST